MKFTKMHGIGNDYIYFDCTEKVLENPEEVSVKLSDRHFGVGGDGVVMIMKSDVADFRMRMFNADGSEGKMCGNATRCIGKYVYDRGLTDKTTVTLETLSGIKTLSLDVKDGKVQFVTVDMGAAIIKADEVPVISETLTVIGQTRKIAGTEEKITCVSMGNPHCIIFKDENVDCLNLEKIGPDYENDKMFPERVNTEFVNVIDENTLKMRVWERGSGETWACGTGACAVTTAAVLNGICKSGEEITVKLRGGDLKVTYTEKAVFMKGPATFVFDGETID